MNLNSEEQTIIDMFLPLDEFERKQKETGIFVEEFKEETNSKFSTKVKLENEHIFDDNSIQIRKHRRFAHYPKHSHQFLEFNYVLSGESKQIINGEEITLKEKQIILLDTNSEHELYSLGENDLLINFLFNTKDLNIDILKKIDNRSAGLTYEFLMNTILGPSYHENYLILDLANNEEIQVTLNQMILEFFSNRPLTKEILSAYSQALFLQLSRVYHSQLLNIYGDYVNSDIVISVLQRIENDFKSISLKDLAEEYGYNRNYLSNLIKEKTNKTFKELVTEQRLKEAHRLILNTSTSIDVISEYVGFSNKTHFYKKFKNYYQMTPQNVRDLK